MNKIIACDVGGTHIRFGLFSYEKLHNNTELSFDEKFYYKTKDFSSFSELLDAAKQICEASVYSFAVAGPVFDNSLCNPPNISWEIDSSNFKEKIFLLNDFVAQAWALSAKYYNYNSPIAVVGAGTGFGKALITSSLSGKVVIASEGGHANFPFVGDDEFKFYSFISNKLSSKNILCDHVISGVGLELLYEFLNGEFKEAKDINLSDDSFEVFKWFARMYARVCRNFVLDTFSTGGLLVSGGLSIRNPNLIKSKEFKESFCDSTYSYFLDKIPIHYIGDEDIGLEGALIYSLNSLST